jgi:hypothetical protein
MTYPISRVMSRKADVMRPIDRMVHQAQEQDFYVALAMMNNGMGVVSPPSGQVTVGAVTVHFYKLAEACC